jgi:hypothetical protein
MVVVKVIAGCEFCVYVVAFYGIHVGAFCDRVVFV